MHSSRVAGVKFFFTVAVIVFFAFAFKESSASGEVNMQINWNTLVKYRSGYLFAPGYYKKQKEYAAYYYSGRDLAPYMAKLRSGYGISVLATVTKERNTRMVPRAVRKNVNEARPLFRIRYLKINKLIRYVEPRKGNSGLGKNTGSGKSGNNIIGQSNIIKYLIIYPRAVTVRDGYVYYEPTKHCKKPSYVSYRFKYNEFLKKAVDPAKKKQVTISVRIDSVSERRVIPEDKNTSYLEGGFRMIFRDCSIIGRSK